MSRDCWRLLCRQWSVCRELGPCVPMEPEPSERMLKERKHTQQAKLSKLTVLWVKCTIDSEKGHAPGRRPSISRHCNGRTERLLTFCLQGCVARQYHTQRDSTTVIKILDTVGYQEFHIRYGYRGNYPQSTARATNPAGSL